MGYTLVLFVTGLLLLLMALTSSLLKRLPLSAPLIYLVAGMALGPYGASLIRLDPLAHAGLLERLTEAAVVISLFCAGLKLRTSFTDPLWRRPVRLAFGSMTVTVALVALVGVFGLGLPLGAAVLLGAVLAPTDPVLASDVQVESPTDRDRLRFSLTGEAGLNDGTAFPFVMLGLGLLGLHDLGVGGWRWLVVDLAWAVAGGLGIGALLGWLVAKLVLYLRREYQEAVGLDDFLALGLIALSYSVALLLHTYGFLAVFAAGLSLRRVELRSTGERPPEDVLNAAEAGADMEIATDSERGPAFMAQTVLSFSEHLERVAAFGVVVLLGGMLTGSDFVPEALWFVPLLFMVIRPAAVGLGLSTSRISLLRRGLIAWFGIRGIGSLYYLMYAITHGLPPDLAAQITRLVLVVVVASILVHGISVTPLMERYARRVGARANATS